MNMKKELLAAAVVGFGVSLLFGGTAATAKNVQKRMHDLFGGSAVDAMTGDANVRTTSVSAQPHRPWDGKVDISFSFTSDLPEAFAFVNFKASFRDKDGKTVEVPMKTFEQFTTAFCATAGTYRVTWDASADAPNVTAPKFKYTVAANMAKYMVVDLSKGVSATAADPYPVTYLEDCPDPKRADGGWTDEYKTTKMVFRLVQPGTYRKGWGTAWSNWNDFGPHDARITRPYYLAIFECTQGQAKQVMGKYFGLQQYEFKGSIRDRRPVACACYHAWRGSNEQGICWPNTGSAVDPKSFIGVFREKTGGNAGFDLPTETEWEFAARAGDLDAWGGDGLTFKQRCSEPAGPTGGKTNTVLNLKGRYKYNGGLVDNGDGTYSEPALTDEKHGTAVVGSYRPNAWGFYDVLGNARELVLDYWGGMSRAATTDDTGPVVPVEKMSDRALLRPFRGGAYCEDAAVCSLVRRWIGSPANYPITGARLCWRFPTPPQAAK